MYANASCAVCCSHPPSLMRESTKITSAFSHCVVKSDRWSLEDDRLREDYYYEALAFSQHSMPEKATKAPRNAGIDPGTMKMNQRC